MRIALDVNGGDFGLAPNIDGAIKAAGRLPHDIILVGREEQIKDALRSRGYDSLPKRVSIVNATQEISMDGEAVEEYKSKPDASMSVAASLVHDGKADAYVSAGNSGAMMVAATFRMKRIKGIVRPAIAALLPTLTEPTLLLDAGANMDCRPINLLQFAVMGSIYMQTLLKIDNPSVGIFSIGEEECKGNALVHETLPEMKKLGINFIGPVEGRDLPTGKINVIVADGFVGNVALKLYEGTAKSVFAMLKERIMSRLMYKVSALGLKGVFKSLKTKMSADIYGGAPLLGIDGIAMVCHGSANSEAIYNALRVSGDLAESGMADKVRQRVEQLKPLFDSLKTKD